MNKITALAKGLLDLVKIPNRVKRVENALTAASLNLDDEKAKVQSQIDECQKALAKDGDVPSNIQQLLELYGQVKDIEYNEELLTKIHDDLFADVPEEDLTSDEKK